MKLTCAIVITGFLYGAFLLGAEGRQLDQCISGKQSAVFP
jgi:hypothetical protein